jgi:hypothetical protein
MFVFFVHGHTSNAIGYVKKDVYITFWNVYVYICVYVFMCYVCTYVFELNIKKTLETTRCNIPFMVYKFQIY